MENRKNCENLCLRHHRPMDFAYDENRGESRDENIVQPPMNIHLVPQTLSEHRLGACAAPQRSL